MIILKLSALNVSNRIEKEEKTNHCLHLSPYTIADKNLVMWSFLVRKKMNNKSKIIFKVLYLLISKV